MRYLISFFLSVLLFSSVNAQIQKQRVAVLQLKTDGLSEAESQTMTDRLRSELVKIGSFTIIERGAMDEILNEQGFQMTGCTSSECAVEAGKLLSANLICTGSIGRVGTLFTISIRLIDVESGKIIKSVTEDCKCNIEKVLTTSIHKVAMKITQNDDSKSSINKVPIGGALVRSIFVPGWGQAYQGKTTRAWIYGVTFAGGLIGSIIYTGKYNQAVDDYNLLNAQYNDATQESVILKLRSDVQNAYDDINDAEGMRNIFYGLTGAIWLWNVVDVVFLEPSSQSTHVSVMPMKDGFMAGIVYRW